MGHTPYSSSIWLGFANIMKLKPIGEVLCGLKKGLICFYVVKRDKKLAAFTEDLTASGDSFGLA